MDGRHWMPPGVIVGEKFTAEGCREGYKKVGKRCIRTYESFLSEKAAINLINKKAEELESRFVDSSKYEHVDVIEEFVIFHSVHHRNIFRLNEGSEKYDFGSLCQDRCTNFQVMKQYLPKDLPKR